MTTPGEATRQKSSPRRDRPTWVSYSQLTIYAYLLYTFGVAITFLRDEEGISRQIASLHGTALALGALVGAVLTPYLTRRIGRGPLLRVASLGIFVGTLFIISGLGFAATMFGTFFYALTGVFAIIGVNAFVTEYQGKAGPAALTEGNALASLGTLVAPVVVGITVGIGWGWRAGTVVAFLALIGLELWRGRNTEVYDASTGHPDDEPGHDPGGKLPRGFWMYALVGACVVGCEFTLVYFSTDFLRERGGLGEAAAAASVATIAGGMMLGRLVISRVVEHVNPEKAYLASVLIMGTGFIIAWVATNPIALLIAMTVTGFGLGPLWPLSVTRAVQSSAGHSDRASAQMSIWSAIAIAILPFVVATVADGIGIHLAMLAVLVLLIVVLGLVLLHPATPGNRNAEREYA